MFCYAHGMILHPRTTPNIPENQHLDGDLGLGRGPRLHFLRWRVLNVSTWEHQEHRSENGRSTHRQRQEEIQHRDVAFRVVFNMRMVASGSSYLQYSREQLAVKLKLCLGIYLGCREV
jgi:hypothetical protein